jgi:hypothetical protein
MRIPFRRRGGLLLPDRRIILSSRRRQLGHVHFFDIIDPISEPAGISGSATLTNADDTQSASGTVSAGGGGPFTDDFSGSFPGANWTVNSGAFSIGSGVIVANAASTECGAHYSAEEFAADQYAEGIAANMAGGQIGVCVRADPGGDDSYLGIYASNIETYSFEMADGSWTPIGSTGDGMANAQAIRAEYSGTTLTTLVNGVEETSTTQTGVSGGKPGISGFGTAGGSALTSWEGGDL